MITGRFLFSFFAAFFLLAGPGSPTAAQTATADQEDKEAPPQTEGGGAVTFTEGTIESDEKGPADADVEARLRDIFGALPAFTEIDVAVADGVVTLDGTVPGRASIAEAETLASRLAGVVAVNNRLEPDLSVDRQLEPLAERSTALVRRTVNALPLIGVAAGIVALFWLLGVVAARQGWLWRRLTPNLLVASLMGTVIRIVLFALGLVIALSILDAVAILSAFLGAAGVLGLAVGFAVRDTIENFIASIMLSLRQPFRARDFVDIDGREGVVVQLTSRATILLTPDGNHLRIPNAQVFKAIITNYTRNPERRFTFDLGVDPADDPLAAIELGVQTLKGLDFVLPDPAPIGWVAKVGDSNIVLTFAPFIDQRQTDFLKAQSAAIAAVTGALEEGGFTLPEPIYRLRIDEVPDLSGLRDGAATGAGGASPAPKDRPQRPKPKTPQDQPDVTPDMALERKAAQDRAQAGEDDLLSGDAPTEFGDKKDSAA